MAIFPGAISTDSDLYIAVNNLSTVLTDNPLTSGATTVNVASTTSFPTVGIITIDLEAIHYTGITATSFTGCTRGFDGTTAASHTLGATVFHDIPAAHHNAPKDEIIAIETHIDTIIGRSTTQIKVPNGSAAAPSVSFASDLDIGMYRVSADKLGWAVTALESLTLANGILDLTANTAIHTQVGSVTVPAIANRNNTDSGLYWSSAMALAVTIDGVQLLTFRHENSVDFGIFLADGFFKFGTDGSATTPKLTWDVDPDSGFYRVTTDTIGLATGGVLRWSVDTSAIIGTLPLRNGVGSATSPTYSFSAETGLGFYRTGTSAIGIAFGTILGAEINFSSGYFDFRGNLNIASSVGSVTVPFLAHRTNLDTGLYFPTTLSLAATFDGIQTVTLRADNSVDKGILINTGFLKMGEDGTAAAPKITWESDSDSGWYRAGANSIGLSLGGESSSLHDRTFHNFLASNSGTPLLRLQIAQEGLNLENSARIYNSVGTEALPSYSFVGDTNTGLFHSGADIVDIVTGAVTVGRFDASVTAGQTRFLVYDVDNATLERVTVGAADSGGVGFKVLRIPN